MNWLNVAIWVTPLALLALIGELHLRATSPKPPLGRLEERPQRAAVKTVAKPTKDESGDSVLIGAVTDSAIMGGIFGGSFSGGLVGKAFRDFIKTPTQPLG